MIQLFLYICIHIYIFCLRFFIIGHYKILIIVPCVIHFNSKEYPRVRRIKNIQITYLEVNIPFTMTQELK